MKPVSSAIDVTCHYSTLIGDTVMGPSMYVFIAQCLILLADNAIQGIKDKLCRYWNSANCILGIYFLLDILT